MRKSILFILIIICTTLLLLFVCANNVNRDEKLYVFPIPSEIKLTDGINSINGSVKANNWYYIGKDNKYYHYQNESSVNGSAINNDLFNDNNTNEKSIISKTHDLSNSFDNNQETLPYNGNLTLTFGYNSDRFSHYHHPDKLNLQIFHEGNLIFEEDKNASKNESENGSDYESKNELDYPVFQPKENGELLYRIAASWYESESANRGFYGEVIYEFVFFNDVPIEFEVSSHQTFPGELITICAKYVNEDEKIILKSDLVESEIPFYKYEHDQIAVLPLSYNLQPSDYIIKLQVEQVEKTVQADQAEKNKQIKQANNDKNPEDTVLKENYQLKESKEFNEHKEAHRITISVLPKDFPIQYLTVSDEVDKSTRNDEAYEEYNKYVGAVRKTNTPVKMWDGVFLKPVEGRITTEFGMRRFVNNAPTSYRHSGIDIAADKGTPVKATNSGKVILARYLILTGNTVLIDHGFGIISWSYHMDSIKVKEGDDLVKGQIIGTVGSTGFSTGPHLHFAISVHNVFTNPWTLFEHEPAGL